MSDKEYETLRIEDVDLKKKIKSRAGIEGRTIIDVVEHALKDYLKKPIYKS